MIAGVHQIGRDAARRIVDAERRADTADADAMHFADMMDQARETILRALQDDWCTNVT